jgi:hypothetical protein
MANKRNADGSMTSKLTRAMRLENLFSTEIFKNEAWLDNSMTQDNILKSSDKMTVRHSNFTEEFD